MPSRRTTRGFAAAEKKHALEHLPVRALVRSLGDRALAWVLALLLCCTLFPLATPASAEPAASDSGSAASTEMTEGPSGDDGSRIDDSAGAATPAPSEGEGATGCPDLDGTAESETEPPSTDERNAAVEEPAPTTQERISFDRSCYATITDSSASAPTIGDVLRAHVFKVTDDQGFSRTEVIDDGTFAYTWYASESRSPKKLTDVDVIACTDSNAFVPADGLTNEYLFVKVTASDGTTAAGPYFLNWPSGILSGFGPLETGSGSQPGPSEPVDPDPDTPEAPDDPGPSETPGTPETPGTDEEGIELTATVTVTGTTRHEPGASFFYANWVPRTSFSFFEGKGTTAWDAFAALLRKNGYAYSTEYGFPSSITTPDGSYTLGMSAQGEKSYWAFYLNGELVDAVSCDYALRDGDDIELRFFDAAGNAEDAPVDIYPEESTPDAPVAWGGFGSNGTGASTSLVTPTTDLSTGWTFDLSEGRADASWSEPLIVDDRIYLATASRFCMMDRSTGEVLGSTALAGPVDRGGCQPIYADGKVVVPLASGRLQAFSIHTLHCIWVSESLTEVAVSVASTASAQQSVASLYVSEGRIYAATAANSDQGANSGRLVCLDMKTGARCWVRENAGAGFYWPGTAQLNGYILVSGENGMLEAIAADSTTGEAAGTLRLTDLTGKMRTAVTSQDDHAYCVTRDGVFHKVSVGEDGMLAETGRVSFAASSASTPTVCNGSAFVGGADTDGSGVLACIDTETLRCNRISGPSGSSLPSEVTGTPLVSNQPSGTFVYFTCAGESGGVYLYKMGDAAARVVYDPESDIAGGISSIAVGPDGSLYCVSGSGRLIELKEQVAASVPEPTPGTDGTTNAPTGATTTPNRPSSPDTATLERMMVAMEAERTLLDVAPRRLGIAPAVAPTTPATPNPEDAAEAEPQPSSLRLPITSLIEDITMHAQDVSFMKWMLFATGGLLAGGIVLLAVILPLRARRNRL